MARIFITGSADGLEQMAARLPVASGHQVVLHTRHAARASEALEGVLRAAAAAARDLTVQDRLLDECARLSGVRMPA